MTATLARFFLLATPALAGRVETCLDGETPPEAGVGACTGIIARVSIP